MRYNFCLLNNLSLKIKTDTAELFYIEFLYHLLYILNHEDHILFNTNTIDIHVPFVTIEGTLPNYVINRKFYLDSVHEYIKSSLENTSIDIPLRIFLCKKYPKEFFEFIINENSMSDVSDIFDINLSLLLLKAVSRVKMKNNDNIDKLYYDAFLLFRQLYEEKYNFKHFARSLIKFIDDGLRYESGKISCRDNCDYKTILKLIDYDYRILHLKYFIEHNNLTYNLLDILHKNINTEVYYISIQLFKTTYMYDINKDKLYKLKLGNLITHMSDYLDYYSYSLLHDIIYYLLPTFYYNFGEDIFINDIKPVDEIVILEKLLDISEIVNEKLKCVLFKYCAYRIYNSWVTMKNSISFDSNPEPEIKFSDISNRHKEKILMGLLYLEKSYNIKDYIKDIYNEIPVNLRHIINTCFV